MASSVRPFGACLRRVRQPASTNATLNGTPRRFLTSTLAPRDELQKQPAVDPPPPPPPPTAASPPVDAAASEGTASKEVPEFMKNWGPLDPEKVEWKRQERRLVRRDGIQPVGSRRRRAVLYRSSVQNTADVPFEQLPYQCFQEARKILLQDRQDKLKEIETQTLRISNLEAQDPSVSGGVQAKETRLRSMRNHLDQLILLADINDPMVKRRFEDGLGDMNKPIYRYLAEQKWRKHKRLVLQQRISQMNIVPDILPALNPVADVDLAFSRKAISPGEFVDSAISEKMPRLTVQVFEPGEKLVTVVVVDADVPVPEEDRFTYRCHFIASNIPLSPTNTSIPLQRIEHEDKKVGEPAGKKIALPWAAPWAHKGAPYHRMAIFVLEQKDAKALDTAKLGQTERDGFILRSFIDKHKLKPIGFSMFRTKWDDSMASVMERAGLAEEAKIEFKRKKVEPLPHKRRTERMR